MDASLSLVAHEDKPAIKFQSTERNAIRGYQVSEGWSPAHGEEQGYGSGTPAEELREVIVPLPDDDQWHNIILAWEAGQYRIFVDGSESGTLSKLAMTRYRDGSILEPGLIFGGAPTTATGAAAVDDIMLYDWCLRAEDANGRTVADSASPVARPEQMPPTVWLWGESPDKADAVTVNCRRSFNGRRTSHIQATLFENNDGQLRKLSTGRTEAYRGLAMIHLEYEPEAGLESDVDMAIDASEEQRMTLESKELQQLMLATQKYVLKVSAGAAGTNPPEREINFVFGLDKKPYRRW